MTANGLQVQDLPKQFDQFDPRLSHSISITQSERGQSDSLMIPLKLDGLVSYLVSRVPTEEELMSCEFRHSLTPTLQWRPKHPMWAVNEDSAAKHIGAVATEALEDKEEKEDQNLTYQYCPPPELLDDGDFLEQRIIGTVGILVTDDGDGFSQHNFWADESETDEPDMNVKELAALTMDEMRCILKVRKQW